MHMRSSDAQAIGLVSDAGMPGISDPGHDVIAAAIEAGVPVVPLPGACAFVTALVASGLPTDAFQFCGFLAPKQGAAHGHMSTCHYCSILTCM